MKNHLLKITYFILFCMALTLSSTKICISRDFRFIAGIGYFSSDLMSIKSSFGVIPPDIKYPMKLTDNYPTVPYYSFSVSTKSTSSFQFGLGGGLFSTGARLAYSDYSGEHTIDNIITFTNFQIFIKYRLMSFFENFDANITLDIGVMSPEIKLIEKIRVFDLVNQKTTSIGDSYAFIQPGFELTYKLKMFVFGANASFVADYDNPLTINDQGFRGFFFAGIDL